MSDIFKRPKRTGVITGQTLIKAVYPQNDNTGNISLTYEEWDKVYSDDILYLAVHLPNQKPIFVEITHGMKQRAWTCEWRSCIIMPYVDATTKVA